MPRRAEPLTDRIRRKAPPDPVTGCWPWTGSIAYTGYALIKADGRTQLAHRVSYRAFIGPIADGLVLDHLCRLRHCVNPHHLEPVPQRVNTNRGVATFTVDGRCAKGLHDITAPGAIRVINGDRLCLECLRVTRRRANKAARDRKRLRG